MTKLASLLGLHKGVVRERRARIRLDMTDAVVYVVGDVHGCLDPLLALEQNIANDAGPLPGRKLIVMLGDYVDRGPASSQVIDHLIAPPPPGFERICLAGNHEIAMLDYLESRIDLPAWLRMGAAPTLQSYGIDHGHIQNIYPSNRQVADVIGQAIPAAHLAFLRSLPILVESSRYVFVHAGIRPELELEKQTDEDLIQIRSAFYDHAHLLTKYVVHGHTIVAEVKPEGMRINIDTGAFFSGRLTALRIWRDKGRYLTN